MDAFNGTRSPREARRGSLLYPAMML